MLGIKFDPSRFMMLRWCVFIFLGSNTWLSAQTVTLSGQIVDAETGRGLANAFVINYNTNQGIFCDVQGRFSLQINKTDTLIASLTGYHMAKFSLKDSIAKKSYYIQLPLRMRIVELKTFETKAPKTFQQIVSEAEKLEKQKARKTDFADAIESPITYLYQQFNRNERSKAKIAELRRIDAKKELIEELFARYLVAEIIAVDESETEEFIQYSGLLNNLERFETEYDLIVYIKQRWERYHMLRD